MRQERAAPTLALQGGGCKVGWQPHLMLCSGNKTPLNGLRFMLVV